MIAGFIISILIGLNPGNLKSEIEKYLQHYFSDCKKIEIEILSSIDGGEKLELIKDRNIKISSNLAYINVKAVRGEREFEKIISVRLKLFKEALICTKNIRRNSSLQEEDFKVEIIETTSTSKNIFNPAGELGSLRNKINLRAGDILFEEYLEPMPIIKNGGVVSAKYEREGVSISFDAKARQEGAEGELISIITNDKKIFKAKVVNYSTVEVIE